MLIHGSVSKIFTFVFGLLAIGTVAASEWGVPQMLGPNVNSGAVNYMPYVTADGKALYFASDRGLTNDDIYVSYWDSLTMDWALAIRLNNNINSSERDLFPSLTPDGKRLYFVRYGWPGGYGSYDIWYSDWDTTLNDWGVPKNAGPNINTVCIEWSACVSRDGKKLYFSSGYREGIGSCDFQGIYISDWDSISGGWNKATFTGNVVSTPGTENYEPSPTMVDTIMYFASGWSRFDTSFQGANDIFVAYFNGTSWYRVSNPGYPLNSAAWDNTPSISADGMRLFFASQRDSPTYDKIFVAERLLDIGDDKGGPALPKNYLLQAFPNPFNASVRINYTVKKTGLVSVSIYNVLGQKVAVLDEGKRQPGNYGVSWAGVDHTGKQLGSGVYFCVYASEGVKTSRKLVFLK